MRKSTLNLALGADHLDRLVAVAENRGITTQALAEAYIEDWLSIEYAELMGQHSRRATYRDGPIAFDAQAREAANRTEENLRRSLRR